MNPAHPKYSKLSLYLLLVLAGQVMAGQGIAAISVERQAQLSYLLKQDCGACHGMTLKGGLGPALLPAELSGKPDELLFHTIREGRPGTPMPPWKSELSDADIHWLVSLLRKGP